MGSDVIIRPQPFRRSAQPRVVPVGEASHLQVVPVGVHLALCVPQRAPVHLVQVFLCGKEVPRQSDLLRQDGLQHRVLVGVRKNWRQRITESAMWDDQAKTMTDDSSGIFVVIVSQVLDTGTQ